MRMAIEIALRRISAVDAAAKGLARSLRSQGVALRK